MSLLNWNTHLYADLLSEAVRLCISDLHFVPRSNSCLCLVRQGGRLFEDAEISQPQSRRLIQSLKSAAGMNIADSRMPQDGSVRNAEFQARLATHPSLHGESLVVRVFLRWSASALSELNLTPSHLDCLNDCLEQTEGLILVSGPTGSGKTTLMHALLHSLGSKAGKVMTLEDPVEIECPNAVQTDLARLPMLSFAQGLRSLMRQDPDTLLIGEVRDAETAQLCIHAALTGHRVLASVHAPDCLGSLFRMKELGIDLSALVNVLQLAVNLRLQVQSSQDTSTEDSAGFLLKTELLPLFKLPREKVLRAREPADIHRLCLELTEASA